MHHPWTRRTILAGGLASLALPSLIHAADPLRKTFELRENAGLRRFGFPVHTLVPDLDPQAGPYRLTVKGKTVPAQFEICTDRDGKTQLALDFNASLGPNEIQTYEIVLSDSEHLTPRGKSLQVFLGGESLFNMGGLIWGFKTGGEGLLSQVGKGKLAYLRDESFRFDITVGSSPLSVIRQPGVKVEVTRSGPFATGLRHSTTVEDAGRGPFRSTIDMTLPSSKSWIEVDWQVDDPKGLVEGMSLSANLLVGEGPTLVDFGANNTVYTVLKPEETATLSSDNSTRTASWVVKRLDGQGTSTDLAVGKSPAEGWAHVMDRTRCTAISLMGFGDMSPKHHLIQVDGKGKVTLRSSKLPSTPGVRRLKAWFHFVPMPVQIGALTSPQAMMNPLQIFWSS